RAKSGPNPNTFGVFRSMDFITSSAFSQALARDLLPDLPNDSAHLRAYLRLLDCPTSSLVTQDCQRYPLYFGLRLSEGHYQHICKHLAKTNQNILELFDSRREMIAAISADYVLRPQMIKMLLNVMKDSSRAVVDAVAKGLCYDLINRLDVQQK